MSSECERVFSRAGHFITDGRTRLAPATIEANECQKDWLRKGVVESYLPRLQREMIRARLQRQYTMEEGIRTFFRQESTSGSSNSQEWENQDQEAILINGDDNESVHGDGAGIQQLDSGEEEGGCISDYDC